MLPLLYEDPTDLVAKRIQLFMKLDFLTKRTSVAAIKLLDLTKKDNFLSQGKLNIGFVTEFYVYKMIIKLIPKFLNFINSVFNF